MIKNDPVALGYDTLGHDNFVHVLEREEETRFVKRESSKISAQLPADKTRDTRQSAAPSPDSEFEAATTRAPGQPCLASGKAIGVVMTPLNTRHCLASREAGGTFAVLADPLLQSAHLDSGRWKSPHPCMCCSGRSVGLLDGETSEDEISFLEIEPI